jgi:hypothetical protein
MSISFTAIGLATLSRAGLVALWWSPALFLHRWLKLTQQTPEAVRSTMLGGTVFALAGSLVMAIVFDSVLVRIGIETIPCGALAGLAIWLGFVMPPMLSSVVYEKKSFELFLINSGFQLVALIVMGAILAGLSG